MTLREAIESKTEILQEMTGAQGWERILRREGLYKPVTRKLRDFYRYEFDRTGNGNIQGLDFTGLWEINPDAVLKTIKEFRGQRSFNALEREIASSLRRAS